MEASATILFLCPHCKQPCRTRQGVAVHVGRSHRGATSVRNREIVRKFLIGYDIRTIAGIHALSIPNIYRIIWKALEYPRVYEDAPRLLQDEAVETVPLAFYNPQDRADFSSHMAKNTPARRLRAL